MPVFRQAPSASYHFSNLNRGRAEILALATSVNELINSHPGTEHRVRELLQSYDNHLMESRLALAGYSSSVLDACDMFPETQFRGAYLAFARDQPRLEALADCVTAQQEPAVDEPLAQNGGKRARYPQGCHYRERSSELELKQPELDASRLPQIPATVSSVTVPLYVPIESVRHFLEQRIPKRFSDAKTLQVIDDWYLSVDVTSWEAERSDLVVTAGDGLHFSSHISGEAKLDVSKILGEFPAKVDASVGLSANPIIGTDWRMHVKDLHLTANLKTAEFHVGGVRLSLRSFLQPKLDEKMREIAEELRNEVSTNDFLEDAAREYWQRLCRSQAIDLGSESESWLEARPISALVAQPEVVEGNIRLQLSLIVETKILARESEPHCPFPQALTIEPPREGRVEVTLPVEIDYSTLQAILADNVVGKRFGENISGTVEGVSIGPRGDALLLETRVSVQREALPGQLGEVVLKLLATPILDAERQSIQFTNFELDVASRDALAAVLGNAVEPFLLRIIESRATFDIEPLLGDRLRDKANAAIAGFTFSNLDLEGHVEDISMVGLAVGPEYLQMVVTASGRINAAIHPIEDFGR